MIVITLEAITERLQLIYDEAGEKKHWYVSMNLLMSSYPVCARTGLGRVIGLSVNMSVSLLVCLSVHQLYVCSFK